MFEQKQVEQWINSLQDIFKNGMATYERFLEMEKDIEKISKYLQDFSNLHYALDVSAIVAVTDTKGKIIYANNKFCEISKYSLKELIGQDHRILSSGFHDKQFFRKMWRTIIQGDVWEGEVKNKAKDGKYYWVKTTIVPLKDKWGKPTMYIAIRTDISEGKFAQEQLLIALQNDFHHVVNSMNNFIFKVIRNEKAQFIYMLSDGKLAHQLDLGNEKMVGKSPEDVFPSETAAVLKNNYEEAFQGEPVSYSYSFKGRQLLTFLSPVYRDGRVIEVIGNTNDISELQSAQEEIEFMAFHDLLTSLPNRRKFSDDLHHIIEKASRKMQEVAVFFLDLDRFKQINDSLGHTVGDELIKEVSILLKKLVGFEAEIYRFAGDEFVLIFPNSNEEKIEKNAKKVLALFDQSIILPSNLQIYTTCSIGVSIYPKHGEDFETLLKNADAAMYAAKTRGRNNYQIYRHEMNESMEEVLSIEYHLREAIENNELELYYQPKLDLHTKEINGMEALLRWHSPIFGQVPPDRFIPIAEETGLIIKIDRWVLEQACKQNKEWNETLFPKPVRVAVNISPLHFRLQNFHHVVERVLKNTELEPNLLEIEITENSFMDQTEESIECLYRLQKLGITVAIDDFGKGFSSLNYLRKFPIDALKIDRSFVHEVSKNSDDAAIIRAITYLAHELNLKVVAEGIETKEVIQLLEEIGCDEIQGYYISKPLPKNEFIMIFDQLFDNQKAKRGSSY